VHDVLKAYKADQCLPNSNAFGCYRISPRNSLKEAIPVKQIFFSIKQNNIRFVIMNMVKIKKTFTVTILLLLTLKALAPDRKSLIVVDSEPVNPYKKLIYAIGMVETKGDTLAYNPVEHAVGYFQIRPVRLKDFNMRTGSKYTMKDLFNYKISEKIFLYYASQIGPNDFEKIARRWNGSGSRTFFYWKQVKKLL
jgi:hypothetical protein